MQRARARVVRRAMTLAIATVVGLLAAAGPALASGCSGWFLVGAVGLVADGERVGVVLLDEPAEAGFFEGDPASLDGARVAWTVDGRSFEPPVATPGLAPYAVDDRRVCDDERCLEPERASHLVVVDEDGDRTQRRLAGPVPHRDGLRGGGCDEPARDPTAMRRLPATGELLVAMGADGVAVGTPEAGWQRRAVDGWAPAPTTLWEDAGLLERLPPWTTPSLLTSAVVGWVLARRHRPRGATLVDRMRRVGLWVAMVLGAGLFWAGGLLALAGGSGEYLLGYAMAVAAPLVLAATAVRPRLGLAVLAGWGAGAVVPLAWFAGVPVSGGLVLLLQPVVAVLVVRLAGGTSRSTTAGSTTAGRTGAAAGDVRA